MAAGPAADVRPGWVPDVAQQRAVRFGRPLSLAMLDIDHFKEYNDTYLHMEGDEVLKRIGKLLKTNLREVDTVARFGGEEFVLLLPDTDKHGAIAVAEKVRRLIEKERFTTSGGEPTRPVTISCGVATYPEDAGEMEELIDHADIALYRAKARGRNRVESFSRDDQDAMPHTKRLKGRVIIEDRATQPPPKTLQ